MTNNAFNPAQNYFTQFAEFMHQTANNTQFWKTMGFDQFPSSQKNEFIQECQKRYQDFLGGMQILHNFSHSRQHTEAKTIWSMGNAKLYDYSLTKDPHAPVLLIVPSLINRAYILDLTDEISFTRNIAQQGIRTFMLDWADLSDDERSFTIEDYHNNYLLPVIEHLENYTKHGLSLMGYCMGGLFTMAAAHHHESVDKIILLATPWDFHAGNEWLIPWIELSSPYLHHLIAQSGELPAETLQYMFTMINPLGIIRKFRALPAIQDNIEKLQEFANVEDWLNDCTPLAPAVAQECLFHWYKDNAPHCGNWRINNTSIEGTKIRQPSLVISPTRDKIVTPPSCEPLTKTLPNAITLRPNTGHIGAIIGQNAKLEVIEPIIEFLRT